MPIYWALMAGAKSFKLRKIPPEAKNYRLLKTNHINRGLHRAKLINNITTDLKTKKIAPK
jgi:hypothetical protein